MSDALDAVFARRSVSRLTEPAPDDDQLRVILEAAAAAPDHGELRPFRFVVLRGAAKDAFGQVLVDAYRSRVPDPQPAALEKERTRMDRAPLVIAVGAVRQDDKTIPWVEQRDAAVAAAENALVAATALGYASMWRTGDPCYDDAVKAALGFGPDDAVVAFLYVGTSAPGKEKPARRPDLAGLVTEWRPTASRSE